MTNTSFTLLGLSAAPGARAAQVLDLKLANVATKLPLFVLNGAQAGPTVLVTAGIHGAEYVGIEAAMRLALGTDLQQLHGRLVIVPISSMTAFAKRAIYVAPPDNKNLNRCFPGEANGSFAEQLADWLFQNLIRKADFYIDLHGGDMNEALTPFSVVSISGDAVLDATSMRLAEAFGLPNIITSEVKGSTISAASRVGVPAVLTEVGGQGLWPEHEVMQMSAGLHGALAFTGSIHSSQPAKPTRVMPQMAWLRSDHDGLFYPRCAVGEAVQAGQVLGIVTDYLGNPVQTALAPIDGLVVFLVTTLAMNIGDPLLAVGGNG